ncbi:hypothetical protein O9H85_19160 [Paenibacillus filicis]|uniref:Uncharacterized protein n=1 Tax=Paenibacillus gyeongsangnamensis TaxID=3388067 RepID=A0ABT4QCC0_9BACL|nr:hypothetical protein [Paenibacillus filicis]MCZ8514501.1 hypothetical protein [Paenibacillus filicis]
MEISIQQDYRLSFTLEAPCFAELHLTARSESDWCRTNGESALLQLTLNGIYNQDIVLFYGNRPLVYPRGLGWLEPGSYELKLSWHPASSPEVRRAFIEEAESNGSRRTIRWPRFTVICPSSMAETCRTPMKAALPTRPS